MKTKFSMWLFIVLGYISSLIFMGFSFYLSSINQPSYTQMEFHKEALSKMDKDMLMRHYEAYNCSYVKEMYQEAKDPISEEKEEGFLKHLLVKLAKENYCGSFYEDDWMIKSDGIIISHDQISTKMIDNNAVINERIRHIIFIMFILMLSWEIFISTTIILLLKLLNKKAEYKIIKEIELLKE